ncbi:hypothetical protein COJ48_23535 [Bacillus cereus]|uniref:hypothetical protein n=1 Tax=Bacillus TaxID=1386 RepID=UPI0009E286A9|nr:hypothetical protein [Bacillus paramycoides]PFD34092.1 hypothetical protein CN285_26035 [Bacillus cereus]PFM60370.1 hypothetical protein COJ48_23535 [Bacillus cereus]PGM61147.1 hypothetical protein CN947_14405 [Bacillus cereus]PGP80321.1 hypothetical protein CN997_17265 [Bacillus cereus]
MIKASLYLIVKRSVPNRYTSFQSAIKNYNRLGDKSITALQWVSFLYYKIGLVYKGTQKIQLKKGLITKDLK